MHIYPTPPSVTAFSTTRDGDASLPIPRLFMPHHQVHGIRTVIIDDTFLRLTPLQQALAMDGVDALSTDLPLTCVCVKTSDCIPVLLWDEHTHVISAVHAGSKGTLQRIVEHNISTLRDVYALDPSGLHAIIGPGIGPDSFEVGDEVYEAFEQAAFPMDKIAAQYPNAALKANAEERERMAREGNVEQPLKWHIDLPKCNEMILKHIGVPEENIQNCGICT